MFQFNKNYKLFVFLKNTIKQALERYGSTFRISVITTFVFLDMLTGHQPQLYHIYKIKRFPRAHDRGVKVFNRLNKSFKYYDVITS